MSKWRRGIIEKAKPGNRYINEYKNARKGQYGVQLMEACYQ